MGVGGKLLCALMFLWLRLAAAEVGDPIPRYRHAEKVVYQDAQRASVRASWHSHQQLQLARQHVQLRSRLPAGCWLRCLPLLAQLPQRCAGARPSARTSLAELCTRLEQASAARRRRFEYMVCFSPRVGGHPSKGLADRRWS